MTSPLNLSISVTTEAQTAAIAAKLAPFLKPQDVVSLKGTLGAGKTAFARALIRSLCGAQIEVPSPTFNLLLIYETARAPIYHYDFYRIEDPEEIWELDVEEAYDTAITIMEWAERLEDLGPQDALIINIVIPENETADTRIFELSGGVAWQTRLKEFKDSGDIND